MPTAYLGLGSNLGNRRAHLRAAVEGLHAAGPIQVTQVSPVYESEAHTLEPEEEQPPFLNAVVEAIVDCPPAELLRIAKQVERADGRVSDTRRWAPRPIDVDLLAVGDLVRNSEALTVPHPRLAERRFVLRPWADLAPNFEVPPPFDATVQCLLQACEDPSALTETATPLSGEFPTGARSDESP